MLSERMRSWFEDGVTPFESQIHAWADEVAALEQRAERLEDALEHCGYDPTDCIDCGGPPHNEWCRFWKLRDVVPLLFVLAEEADLDKLATQQKPTEEAMLSANPSCGMDGCLWE